MVAGTSRNEAVVSPQGHSAIEAVQFDPATVVAPGRFDAVGLLIAWFVRRSSWPALMLGLAVVAVVDQLDEPVLNLQDPASVVRAALSPWVGVVMALGLRLVANLGALALAFRLSSGAHVMGHVGERRLREWRDRWYRTAAYRALRWTLPVRRLAAHRLGRDDAWLRQLDLAWTIGTVAAGIVAVAAVAVTASP